MKKVSKLKEKIIHNINWYMEQYKESIGLLGEGVMVNDDSNKCGEYHEVDRICYDEVDKDCIVILDNEDALTLDELDEDELENLEAALDLTDNRHILFEDFDD